MQDFQQISSLEFLEFFAKNLVEGFITGKHKSPYHGFSVEFAEHRIYNRGDSTRHVDWKLFGRTNKLFIKRFEEETNLRCRVIIDTSSSMSYPVRRNLSIQSPNKLLYSIYSTASLMNLFKKQRDAVGLSLFSDKVHFHSDTKTTNKHHISLKNEMLNLLSVNQNEKTTSIVESIHDIASRIHRRSLVFLFTDFLGYYDNLDEIFLALQHLKFNKHELVLFHLFDKSTEIDFEFDNLPMKFIDLENNEEIRLNPVDVRNEYINNTKLFFNDLKVKCLQHKIDLVEVNINESMDKILHSYLLKRQKMF